MDSGLMREVYASAHKMSPPGHEPYLIPCGEAVTWSCIQQARPL